MSKTLKYKIVSIKKDRACDYCGLIIPQGQKMYSIFVVDGGDSYKAHRCIACAKHIEETYDYGDDDIASPSIDWLKPEYYGLGDWRKVFVENYGQQPLIDDCKARIESLWKLDDRIPSKRKDIQDLETEIHWMKVAMEAV